MEASRRLRNSEGKGREREGRLESELRSEVVVTWRDEVRGSTDGRSAANKNQGQLGGTSSRDGRYFGRISAADPGNVILKICKLKEHVIQLDPYTEILYQSVSSHPETP